MYHQANPNEKLADNPQKIWLAPRCNIDERPWCENDQGCCDECGEPTVEYVRGDIVDDLLAALKAISEFWAYGFAKPAGAAPTAEDHQRAEELGKMAADALFKATGK